MTILKIWFAVTVAVASWAQGPSAVVSPEVHGDRRITFRMKAPKASDVSLFGDWMKPGSSEKMTKNGEVWSITVGPMPPSIYLYSFIVDGMTIADPVNPRIKL